MSNKIIYYVSLSLSGKHPTLERQMNTIDENFVFNKCPVVTHKLNRTFVCFSPIDFYVKIDRNNKKIICDYPQLLNFDDNHLYGASKPVIQLAFCPLLFWTNESDIWFEFNDYPTTSLYNNFTSINGWFNISNWPRVTSLTAVLVDEKKPIIIKKGDPLFRVSFHSPNLNDGIILKEEKNDKKIKEIYNTMNKNKNSFSGIKSLRKLFYRSETIATDTNEKKCPFRFLYK
jgi:hypothetical protein